MLLSRRVFWAKKTSKPSILPISPNRATGDGRTRVKGRFIERSPHRPTVAAFATWYKHPTSIVTSQRGATGAIFSSSFRLLTRILENIKDRGCHVTSLYHTNIYSFFPGPKVSHPHAMSRILCIPFHIVSTPGGSLRLGRST